MLSRLQTESHVLAVYDAVCAGRRIEDSLVELKRDWPSPPKAARRIAAHANAARGEAILWLIGLDERIGVVAPSDSDLAQWWAQVRTWFDGEAPRMRDFIVHTESGPIHVLQFDSAAGPFVVRNPEYGKPGAGSIEREVPWRSGTSVRSATREDLVRILAPLQPLPAIQLLKASLTLQESQTQEPFYDEKCLPVELEPHLTWLIWLEMYVSPQVGTVSVLPVHQTDVEVSVGGATLETITDGKAHYSRPSYWGVNRSQPDSVSVEVTSSEAVVHLPGRLYYNARLLEPLRAVEPAQSAEVRFQVMPVYTEHSVRLDVTLNSSEPVHDEKMVWRTDPSNPRFYTDKMRSVSYARQDEARAASSCR